MKKIISVLIVGLMLLVSTNTVLAADDSLDIEKVAIQAIKNSQDLQTYNKMVTLSKKYYEDSNSAADAMRALLGYQNSYSTLVQIVFLPLNAKNNMTQTTNSQAVVTNAVRLSAYQDYINLLKADYAENIQQGLMNGLDADYRTAKQQEGLGMISSSQLRLSEIAYLKAQYSYNSAQKSFGSASMTLNKLMGEDLTKQYSILQDNNISPAAQIKSLNDYINIALANRVDIKNAQSTLDTDKQEFDYSKAEPATDYEFTMQKLQYNLDKAQNDLDLKKISVQKDITNLYKTLQGAMKNLEAMKDLNDQAAANYQAAEIQYKNSQISLQEFDDAKVTKAQADVNYKNAQLDAWLVQTMMNTACSAGYVPSTNASSSTMQSSSNKVNPTEQLNSKNRN
ncbi:TolC family protein [Desulfosporosinus sp. SB140]|uniref:TolC family protein n=1 Tax=Desulfosporosinus paludis TaxID=3115649 RepID=UPI00388DB2A9